MKSRKIDRFQKKSTNNTAHNPASAASNPIPAPSVTQVSVFRSPAARRLRVLGLTAGAAWGTFAGVGMSFAEPNHLVRDTVGGAVFGSLFLGTLGFFTGAAGAAAARTTVVRNATGAVRNFVKNKF